MVGQAFTVLEQVMVIFLLIAVGFFCAKGGLFSQRAIKQLSNFVLTIVSAALVLDTFQAGYQKQTALELLWALGLSFLILLLGWGVSQLLRFKARPETLSVEQFGVIFPNSGYMGIPLLLATVGPVGVLYSCAFMTAFQLLSWSLGVGLLTREKSKKLWVGALTSPVVLAVLFGIPLFLLQIKFPQPIAKALDSVASLLTPLSMIVSGGFIAKSRLKQALLTPRNYLVSGLRLIVIPLMLIPLLASLPVSDTLKSTMLILSCSPCATGTIQFASRFGGDVAKASGIFFISTLCCIATIPLATAIGQSFW